MLIVFCRSDLENEETITWLQILGLGWRRERRYSSRRRQFQASTPHHGRRRHCALGIIVANFQKVCHSDSIRAVLLDIIAVISHRIKRKESQCVLHHEADDCQQLLHLTLSIGVRVCLVDRKPAFPDVLKVLENYFLQGHHPRVLDSMGHLRNACSLDLLELFRTHNLLEFCRINALFQEPQTLLCNFNIGGHYLRLDIQRREAE
mmetsp:Transcript_25822/g.47091  ORF Transcript_25822/g.47091 Transcript_25822/m.47091 type:complete len:205 (-) Transcript_25822:339-953(-)